MQLIVHLSGNIHCLYGEAIDLAALGQLAIRRGSCVEPDDRGQWFADLAPCDGPRLGPFNQRSEALQAEERWLNEHWLSEAADPGPCREEAFLALAIIA
jgi:hypothetical protein